MEVTFDIDDDILERLRLEAEHRGKTMSAIVESALQTSLPEAQKLAPLPEPTREPLPPLPTWRAEFLVDVSNRDELYRVLDDDPKFKKLYGYPPDRVPEQGN